MAKSVEVKVYVADAVLIKRVLRFATDVSRLADARPDDKELRAMVNEVALDLAALEEEQCESES